MADVKYHPRSPWGIASHGIEDAHQEALFCWANHARLFGFGVAFDPGAYGVKLELLDGMGNSMLKWLHSIPNGGERNRASAGTMKATGVKPGIADVFLPYRVDKFAGVYIELKRPLFVSPKTSKTMAGGKLSDVQREFGAYVLSQGYLWAHCVGWEAAAKVLAYYITYRTTIAVDDVSYDPYNKHL